MNHKPNTNMGGYWVFPGGKAEPDECEYDTAQRELQEEVGLDIDFTGQMTEFMKVICHDWIATYYTFVIGEHDVNKMIICSREFSEHKWVTLSELKHIISTDKCSSHFGPLLVKLNKMLD